MSKNTFRFALWQTHAFENENDAVQALRKQARAANKQNAHCLCVQELFLNHYFPARQDPKFFDLARKEENGLLQTCAEIARTHKIALLISFFEKDENENFYNSLICFDAQGKKVDKYRKCHIPQDPGFEEKYYFQPGNDGFKVWQIADVKIGVIICWDQWFPEAARILALQGAQIIFCPTAIGSLDSEDKIIAKKQKDAWQTVQRGHAIANGVYFAAVNRVGKEGELNFWGGSFVADYFGKIIQEASQDSEELLICEANLAAARRHRRIWPFRRDRRPDLYKKLTSRNLY